MAEQGTEGLHPHAAGLHAAAPDLVLTVLLEAQMAALARVRPALPALERAAEAGAAALQGGHRMGYAGAGSAGLMALADCLELAGTFGIAPARTPMLFPGGAAALLQMTGAAEDDPAQAEPDLARAAFGPGDCVICVSASGSTPYTLAVARGARAAGATVICIANNPGAPLLLLADVPVLLETGPEVVAGSTRMGAATAQKAALNLISVLVGIRLGHVLDGQMINLVADNAKLLARAARIVAAVAGCDATAAEAALAAGKGHVKPAILMARGASAAEAEAALLATGGLVSAALATLSR